MERGGGGENAPRALGEVGAPDVRKTLPRGVCRVGSPNKHHLAMHEQAWSDGLAVPQELAWEGGGLPPPGLETDCSRALRFLISGRSASQGDVVLTSVPPLL